MKVIIQINKFGNHKFSCGTDITSFSRLFSCDELLPKNLPAPSSFAPGGSTDPQKIMFELSQEEY